jgi:RNA polymerase sigma-70 factor (ECF subfamily)
MKTPVSLLERLRQPGDREAWDRFVELYTPLIFHWARRAGSPPQDAADLVQEVFVLLLQKLPQFHYEPGKSFRAWLHTVTVNKWRENWRSCRARRALATGDATLDDVPAPDEAAALWETEYRRQIAGRALQLMQRDFEPATWKACWEHGICRRPAREVAEELGISVNVVYLSTSRVLRRLREELAGLLD